MDKSSCPWFTLYMTEEEKTIKTKLSSGRRNNTTKVLECMECCTFEKARTTQKVTIKG